MQLETIATVTNRLTRTCGLNGFTANIAGRITAKNITGAKIAYPGVLGTVVAKLRNLILEEQV